MGDRLSSLPFVLALIQAERDKLQSHFESLDQRAGLVLAAAGVFVSVSPRENLPLAMWAVAFSVVAALSALSAFWPRQLPLLQAQELRQWLRVEEPLTRLSVLDTLTAHEPITARMLRRKARRLKAAMGALSAAALLSAISRWI
jgi:putative SOS response-associated peptidase YedK